MAAQDDDGGADLEFFLLVVVGAYWFWQLYRDQLAAQSGGGVFQDYAPADSGTEGILNILIPMSLSPSGAAFIKSQEGFRATAYPDGKGHTSIGYGHQIQPGESFPGAISQSQANNLFSTDSGKAEKTVSDALQVQVSQNQFDALVDFCYNIGPSAFLSSTLLRLLNSGDYNGASQQFTAWEKSGGANRRVAETNLFNAG